MQSSVIDSADETSNICPSGRYGVAVSRAQFDSSQVLMNCLSGLFLASDLEEGIVAHFSSSPMQFVLHHHSVAMLQSRLTSIVQNSMVCRSGIHKKVWTEVLDKF